MNSFDVQAIGWIMTRDLGSDAARTFVGMRPRLEREALGKLARRWLSVDVSVREDHRLMSCTERIISPRRTALSKRSEAAMKAFICELVAVSPRRYAYEALRSRCLGECGRLIATVLCFLLLGRYASPDMSLVAWASLGFLLVACWSVVTTVQLLRMCRLIRRLVPSPYSRMGKWQPNEPR